MFQDPERHGLARCLEWLLRDLQSTDISLTTFRNRPNKLKTLCLTLTSNKRIL